MTLQKVEVEFKTGPHAGMRVSLGDRLFVGESGDWSIRVEADRRIAIERRGIGYRVRDLMATSGSLRVRVPGAMRGMLPSNMRVEVNDQPVGRERNLRHGDVIKLGDIEIVFHDPAAIDTITMTDAGDDADDDDEATGTTAYLTSAMRVRDHDSAIVRDFSETDARVEAISDGDKNRSTTTFDKERYLLHKIMRIGSDEADQTKMLERLADALKKALLLDRVVVVLHERLGNRLIPAVVRRGVNDPKSSRIAVPLPVLEKCVEEGISTLLPGAETGSSDAASSSGSDDGTPWGRSIAVAPLTSRGRSLGAIYVDREPGKGELLENDLRLVATCGKQIGMAIERTRALQDAREKATDLVNTTRELERRSAQLEAERAWLQAVIEGIDAGLIFLDPRGRPALCNARASELLRGMGHQEPSEAASLGKLLFNELVRSVLADPTGRSHDEVAIEGEELDQLLEVRGAPVIGSGGPEGVALLVRDVTDERFRDARLRQSEKLSAMGEMMAGVAHELNNPLAAINGFSELLQRGFTTASQRIDALDKEAFRSTIDGALKDIQAISHEALRCHRVVRNLLGLARRKEPERTEVALNDVVTAITGILSPEARRRGVVLEVKLAENLPSVLGDGHELQQVVYNLVMNAIHAAVASGEKGHITVATSSGVDTVALAVRDNGPGIEEKLQKRIFQPFFTTKPEGKGTGLGLPIAQRIARSHGGTLSCVSTPGRGTTFILELPAVRSGVHPPMGFEGGAIPETPPEPPQAAPLGSPIVGEPDPTGRPPRAAGAE